jgi:Flp pilus assembly protein TadG
MTARARMEMDAQQAPRDPKATWHFLRFALRRATPECIRNDQGATLVEMALSLSVLLAMLFGIIELSMALFAYNFASEAAREATRYAAVRGAPSCTVLATFPNCNLNPTTTGNPLQTYVQRLGYPFAQNMTVTANWYSPSGSPGNTWTTACTAATCNAVGNAVQVTVSYVYPLSIPFWQSTTINISSTSQMVISE